MRRWPSSLTQCIFVSTRRASLRATAPAVSGFHGLAFLRGGVIATARISQALAERDTAKIAGEPVEAAS
jgi:hypothetical protein